MTLTRVRVHAMPPPVQPVVALTIPDGDSPRTGYLHAWRCENGRLAFTAKKSDTGDPVTVHIEPNDAIDFAKQLVTLAEDKRYLSSDETVKVPPAVIS